MKRLLYIGNKLSGSGKNPTGIEILGPLLESEGFAVQYASSAPGKIRRLFEMIANVVKLRGHVDYVLIDTYSTSNFWYAFIVSQLCRVFGLKYVPVLHGGNLPGRLKKNPGLSRMVFANSHLNVAPSAYLAESFSQAGYDGIRIIPNPIPTAEITFKARDVFSPRLLWVRSLSSIYNPEMALRTLLQLKQDFPDAALCMIGPDGGELDNLRQMSHSLGLLVDFKGRLSKSQWMSLASEYDFFLNTSNVDNTPFSLLEAAALGLAIVSTNVGGIPYLFENNSDACLVPADDSEAMAEAVTRLMKNPQTAREMTARAQKTALASDWKNVRQAWLEILS